MWWRLLECSHTMRHEDDRRQWRGSVVVVVAVVISVRSWNTTWLHGRCVARWTEGTAPGKKKKPTNINQSARCARNYDINQSTKWEIITSISQPNGKNNIRKETITINQSTRWERNHQHPSVNQVGKKPSTSISQPGGKETTNINQSNRWKWNYQHKSTNQVGKKPPSSINQLTNQDSNQSMH